MDGKKNNNTQPRLQPNLTRMGAATTLRDFYKCQEWWWFIQDGAPKIAKLPYFSGFMVDITIVNRCFIGL